MDEPRLGLELEPIQEVTHIAVIQYGGIVGTKPTESEGFASYEEAAKWVSSEVREAHGVEPSCTRLSPDVVHYTSPEGPVQGWVLTATEG